MPIKMDYNSERKVCIVTGGNSGLGFATALGLAKNNARVIIACRSSNKAAKAVNNIQKISGNKEVDFIPLELSSFDSIRTFVKSFNQRNLRLDILINNAGIFNKRGITKEGFELIWGTNYLGHFLLTNLLIENLKNSPSSRVITISSNLAKQAKSIKYDLLEGKTPFNFLELYSVSKLCLLLLTVNLANKFSGTNLTMNAIHPGFVQSNISVWHQLSKYLNIGLSPEKAAFSCISCAVSPELEGVTGKFFDSKIQEIELPKIAQSKELSEELWERSLIWTGLNSRKSSLEPKYDAKDGIFGAYSLDLRSEINNYTQNIFQQILPNAPTKLLINSWFKSLLNLKFGSLILLLIQISKKEYYMERHLDSDIILKLCHDDNLLKKVKEYLGENIILWRSEIWANYPSQELIPLWHQDSYPKLLKGEGKSINAYIALTEVNEFNGFKYIPTKAEKNNDCVVKMSDPFSGNHFFQINNEVEENALPVVLKPGEFVLFSERLIHRSIRNTSGQIRLSLTLRFTQAQVEIVPGYSPIYKPSIVINSSKD